MGFDQQQFGERVRMAREQLRLSQQSLAAKTGMRQSQLSDIERGKLGCGLSTLYALCKTLEKRADYLLGLEE